MKTIEDVKEFARGIHPDNDESFVACYTNGTGVASTILCGSADEIFKALSFVVIALEEKTKFEIDFIIQLLKYAAKQEKESVVDVINEHDVENEEDDAEDIIGIIGKLFS